MGKERSTDRPLRACATGLFVLLGSLLALGVVPALASAATFTVTGTGDGSAGAGVSCPAVAGKECTLRAAIDAANGAAGPDTINFDPAFFNGRAGDTISPAALPAVSTPTTIDGTNCNGGSAVSCLNAANSSGQQLLLLSAGETKVEHLSLIAPSGTVGIRASGSAGGGAGVEILDNTISLPDGGTTTGIEVPLGSSGDLIEGNRITTALGFNFPIALRGNSNRILGNEISGSGGCCQAGITLSLGASGNQIGGDSAGSENEIGGYGGGAVSMSGSSNNEVRRNRGEDSGNFISGAGITGPAITEALQSSVSGTAEPGATVRVFRKATEGAGEIEGFLAETTADATTGAWKVTFAKVPAGTFVAATQTVAGSTSGLGETKALAKEPETGGGGGGGSGGGTATGTLPAPPVVPNPPPSIQPLPTVKITSGPKKSSTATTAKFKFKAEPPAGAKFECKLDAAKWAKCTSPKTYKKLKPGKHTFRVRAIIATVTGGPTKYQFTVKS